MPTCIRAHWEDSLPAFEEQTKAIMRIASCDLLFPTMVICSVAGDVFSKST